MHISLACFLSHQVQDLNHTVGHWDLRSLTTMALGTCYYFFLADIYFFLEFYYRVCSLARERQSKSPPEGDGHNTIPYPLSSQWAHLPSLSFRSRTPTTELPMWGSIHLYHQAICWPTLADFFIFNFFIMVKYMLNLPF